MVGVNEVKIKCPNSPSCLAVALTVEYTKGGIPIHIEFGSKDLQVEIIPKRTSDFQLSTVLCICRFLARVRSSTNLYGKTVLEKTEVDHWLEFSNRKYSVPEFKEKLQNLNQALSSITYLVGQELSLADISVWCMLYENKLWHTVLTDGKVPVNVLRWYQHLQNLENFAIATKLFPEMAENRTSSKTEDIGKFIELPGAKMGEVVVRFPPEASGFLHIGHAKAALLNAYYQKMFNGKLIMRFDDTNPEKEKEDFEKVILEDVAMLQIKPDIFTYTSDHFNLILQKCRELIENGLAYVDDTDAETMKLEREGKTESKNRANNIEKNLSMWAEMVKGSEFGKQCCVRAKINMQSDNGCLRDPTLYRCKTLAHPRTGNMFNVYPTYDFACPIVDSVEGVTHALRTTEYHDRDEQYFWVIEKLNLRKLHIYEYSRLNMTHTVLSKRKLTWFVQQGIVNSWEDPRMPTVRGVLRRGMTVEGLKQFIVAQGSSRSVVVMEWDKIWAFNRKIIDPIAPRYNAVETNDKVQVLILNCHNKTLEVAKHPKNNELGTKTINIGPKLFVDYADAEAMRVGEIVTFINWGNMMITDMLRNSDNKIELIKAELNLENKDYKKTLKVTWVCDNECTPPIPCACLYYDHLISKSILGKDEDFKDFLSDNTKIAVMMMGDPDLEFLKKGDIIQIQRKGFFICDEPYDASSLRYISRASPVVLISIPDGSKDISILPRLVRDLRTNKESSKEAVNRKKGKLAEKSPQDEVKLFSPYSASPIVSPGSSNNETLNERIKEQGDKIRIMKSQKCSKDKLTPEINLLLKLKSDYKNMIGKEWKPVLENQTPKKGPNIKDSTVVMNMTSGNSSTENVADIEILNGKIKEQGDRIRILKSQNYSKDQLKPEIDILLKFKSEYKKVAGKEWKPIAEEESVDVKSVSTTNTEVATLNQQIKSAGDQIRQLKCEKVSKETLAPYIDILLKLKSEYKKLAGKEWKPTVEEKRDTKSDLTANTEVAMLDQQIKATGDQIRQLKTEKANKETLTPHINTLLKLKSEYKKLVGKEWRPPPTDVQKVETKKNGSTKGSEHQKQNPFLKDKKAKVEHSVKTEREDETDSSTKKITRLGLEAKKEENLADWYSQTITKAEMIEYYDVSGCYILRPWAYGIWEAIVNFFDPAIKALGVSNSYFPMFVSPHALEKEKTHIADFAPEVAWVTKSGNTDLAEPIAIRPTSETVMYPSYAKWIRSHRDLPLKLNQWCSVVRWEFKNPQPFLRTREFLWQEGHTAFATRHEAVEEVYQILELYAKVYESLLAIPVVRGQKTEKEKFAGADFTTTLEAYVSANGRAIQGATSHHLGQNFSKMFEIIFDDPETSEKCFAYQNSWGLTTRTIGVMVMVHGDNMGLVLPPRVAVYQIVIVPCGITANLSDVDKMSLFAKCNEFEFNLKAAGIRVKGDYRDNYSPGWKFNHWELKGVPIRIELGPRDVKKNQFVAVRRDTGEKSILDLADGINLTKQLLDKIHNCMYAKAKKEMDENMVVVIEWEDFCAQLDQKCIIQAPFCGEISCEDKIKKDSARNADDLLEPGAPSMGAKGLCIPVEQPREITPDLKCINPSCCNKPKYFTLFGRSY